MVKVINIHWGFSFGGVSQYAAAIDRVEEFAPIRMMSVCIVSHRRHVDEEAVRRLRNHVIVRRSGPLDLRWVKRLRSLIKAEQPDLVFTHGFNAHIVAAATLGIGKRRPVFVASYHGQYHPPTKWKKVLERVYNLATDLHLRYVARSVVSVAETGKKYLISKGISENKIDVIHNGIEDVSGQADSAELRAELGLPPDCLVVGVVSRLEPIKGIDYLLKAFSGISDRIPPTRLVVIGAGVQQQDLMDLAARLGVDDRVTFAGFRPNASRYMDALDVFALPSLSEFHSVGLLEAMRAGKAIVATDVGGNTESITNGAEGLVVRPASVGELENALSELLRDDGLRARLGSAARRRFEENFVVDEMVRRTAQFLMRAAKGPYAERNDVG